MFGTHICVNNTDEAYAQILSDLLDKGIEVSSGTSLSIGSQRQFKELLGYTTVLSNPRCRLIWAPNYRLNLPGAVARFIWMMGGNNRLKDIEFYWGEKVRPFSDDGIVIPGSNYGMRMLYPAPGLDQLRGVIKRLQEDPSSRRAGVVIWRPEDAVRDSRDIPCALAVFFFIRNNSLITNIIMRSNNAYRLFPYNIFEFSLLGELVAAQLEVEAGPVLYTALSMHLYKDDYDRARQAIQAIRKPQQGCTPTPMEPIPIQPQPIEQVKRLVQLESDVRHAAAGFHNVDTLEEYLKRGEDLAEYWRQYYYIIMYFAIEKLGIRARRELVAERLNSYWLEYLPNIQRAETYSQALFYLLNFIELFSNYSRERRQRNHAPLTLEKIKCVLENLDLLSQLKNEDPLLHRVFLSILERCEEVSREIELPISADEFHLIATELIRDLAGLQSEPVAAREIGPTKDEILDLLTQIRNSNRL